VIRIFVLPDASGETLIVGIKRKDKWIKCEMRCEKFYSHKRVARLLRELAQRVEDFNGEDRKDKGRESNGDGQPA
jgi:hypothetical protein